MSYTKNKRKHHNRQIKRQVKRQIKRQIKYKIEQEKYNLNDTTIVKSLKEILDVFFPSVLSTVIESYTQFCGNMIDANITINISAYAFAVCGDEIFVLDMNLTIYVYNFESYRLLRTFDINSYFDYAPAVTLMCVTDNYIYINHGRCSCCKSDYMCLCKHTGMSVNKLSGDFGRHVVFKTHKDKLYVHSYDPLSELSIDCSPMYIRNFDDFGKCKSINFCKENNDFDCDKSYIFYIDDNNLYRYNINTGVINNISDELRSINSQKESENISNISNISNLERIFLVENTIMISTQLNLHVFDKNTFKHLHTNYFHSTIQDILDSNKNTFMYIFKNKLFMWDYVSGVRVYELY